MRSGSTSTPPSRSSSIRWPRSSATRSLDEGPLPFLFNMKAQRAKERYQMTLSGPEPGGYSVLDQAQIQGGQGSLPEVQVSLDKESLLPVQITLISPDSKSSKDFRLEHISPNVAVSDEWFQGRPLKGWKVTRIPDAQGQSRANVGAAPDQPATVHRARPGREVSDGPAAGAIRDRGLPGDPTGSIQGGSPFLSLERRPLQAGKPDAITD